MISRILDILHSIKINPIISFIYGIFAQWYIATTIAGIIVTYWIFKGLEQTELLSKGFNILTESISHSKAIAQHCTPKILHIKSFWNCISNPGSYSEIPEEKDLENIAQQIKSLTIIKEKIPNPYDN